MKKTIKYDIFHTVLYLVIAQFVAYLINNIIVQHVNNKMAGHYFTAVAILTFISNVFILGGNSVLIKTIPILRKKFSNSILRNVYNLLFFFFGAFASVFIVFSVFDATYYHIHTSQLLFSWDNYYDPVAMFLFTSLFLILTNFFTAFFRAYHYIKTMYWINIISVVAQFGFFYIGKYHLLHFSYNYNHNIIYNYLTFFLLSWVISTILFAVVFYFVILKKIKNRDRGGSELYEDWKNDIKFYIFMPLQNDFILVNTIIIKIFSHNPHDVAIYSYILGIIGFIYIVKKICKQVSQNYFSEYIANNKFKKLKNIMISLSLINTVIIAIIVAVLISFKKYYLARFDLHQYYDLIILLFFSESLLSIADPLFTNFLLFYNKASLKIISTFKIVSYIIFSLLSILITYYYELKGTLLLYFSLSILTIIIEAIIFSKYFMQFKRLAKENNIANI